MDKTACKCQCQNKTELEKTQCRYRIEYPEDDNCCLVSIEKNGDMDLVQISERMGVTFQRIAQIEKAAIEKIRNIMKEED